MLPDFLVTLKQKIKSHFQHYFRIAAQHSLPIISYYEVKNFLRHKKVTANESNDNSLIIRAKNRTKEL